MAPAQLWARAEWRRRPSALIVLIAFIAIGGGIVLTVAAGAHRTATAYDRLVAATNRYDVYVQDDDYYPLLESGQQSIVHSDFAKLPGVRAHDMLALVFAAVGDDAGASPLAGDPLLLAGGRNGSWGYAFDTPRLTDGRAPRPDRPEEVMLNDQSATQFGLGVGDSFTAGTYSPEQLDALISTGQLPETPEGPELNLRVVGVGRLPDDLDNPDAAGWMSAALAARAESAGVGGLYNMARVDLVANDAPTQQRFVDAVRELPNHNPDSVYFTFGKDDSARVIDGIVVQSVGLWVFAAFAGVAVAFVVGQAIARQMNASAIDGETLLSMGCTPRHRVVLIASPVLPIVAIGCVLAPLGAFAASGLMPFGLAGRAEPTPGLRLDPLVHVGGAGAMLVLGFAATLAMAAVAARRRLPIAAPTPSRISRLAIRAGLRPAALTGVRMALDPERGRRRIPVRSTLIGVVVGVATVVAALVFGSSLGDLSRTPRLYGAPWDLIVGGGEDVGEMRDIGRSIAEVETVDSVGLAIFREIEVDGVGVQAAAIEPVKGDVATEALSGRLASGDHEIALGPKTARALDVSIGDQVTIRVGGERDRELTFVGTVLHGSEDGEQLGSGAVLTFDALDALASSTGYSGLLVELGAGGTIDDVVAVAGNRAEVFPPEPPAAVTNLDLAKSSPAALAWFLALLAVAAAAHGIATSTNRRRHDLAVLRAIGFVRRDVSRAVAWQATVIAMLAVAVGVPIGVVLGRQVWRVVAERVPVIPQVSVPVAMVAAVGLVAFLVTNVVALPPGWRARRVRAAYLLRTE